MGFPTLNRRRRSEGFTLIELMVAVVIVGILAAVAYPAFTSFLQRGRRADAAAALSAVVQAQERYRSNRGQYASDLDDLKIAASSKLGDFYGLKLSPAGAADYASGYQVTATVKEAGRQRSDVDCWTLSARFADGDLSYQATDKAGKDTKAQCWSH
ncbi:MAG: prepilin-type N-terminal cleavage/methylation domain-containing protein [Burkholderiales bacterium]|nr:MAG: prepilin-type N-terminal cleavage/methylation domain-containing protein [Burkholderiales bacterium]